MAINNLYHSDELYLKGMTVIDDQDYGKSISLQGISINSTYSSFFVFKRKRSVKRQQDDK
jgi:hypothetical protein